MTTHTESELLDLGLRVARTVGRTRERCLTDVYALRLPRAVEHIITNLTPPIVRPNRQQDLDIYAQWRAAQEAAIAVALDEAGL